MTENHTPIRWSMLPAKTPGVFGIGVASTKEVEILNPPPIEVSGQANARTVLASLNACIMPDGTSIPNKALEDGVVVDVIEALTAMMDEDVGVSIEAMEHPPNAWLCLSCLQVYNNHAPGCTVVKARNALAKLKETA